MGTEISCDLITGRPKEKSRKQRIMRGKSPVSWRKGHRRWLEDEVGSRESTAGCGKVMREWGSRLRLKRRMKITQRDQSAKSCLLPYHCNSGFGKEIIYIKLLLSLWRLILGGCGLIYEDKLVKIELWALMVPFNMILSLPASTLWCLWDCFTSPLNPRPSKAGAKRAAVPLQHSWYNCNSYLKEVLKTHLAHGITFLISDGFSDFFNLIE